MIAVFSPMEGFCGLPDVAKLPACEVGQSAKVITEFNTQGSTRWYTQTNLIEINEDVERSLQYGNISNGVVSTCVFIRV